MQFILSCNTLPIIAVMINSMPLHINESLYYYVQYDTSILDKASSTCSTGVEVE